jgi:hypothetical protein
MCVLIPDTAGTGAHHQSSRGATSRLGRARCPRSRRATYADVCWRMLAYADVCKQTGTRSLPSKQACYVCWRMLTYADVCWRMLTYWDALVALEAGVLRMLTYADVCWRMLTYADVLGRARCPRSRRATYADVCWRMLTYADVLGRARCPRSRRATIYVSSYSVCTDIIYVCMYVCIYIYIYIYTYIVYTADWEDLCRARSRCTTICVLKYMYNIYLYIYF